MNSSENLIQESIDEFTQKSSILSFSSKYSFKSALINSEIFSGTGSSFLKSLSAYSKKRNNSFDNSKYFFIIIIIIYKSNGEKKIF